jgi:hypothetical protein
VRLGYLYCPFDKVIKTMKIVPMHILCVFAKPETKKWAKKTMRRRNRRKNKIETKKQY